ncbi:hypothetical protein ES703_20041 [subsurface metagenome]
MNKDWTTDWFTARDLLKMNINWDNRLTFHDKVCAEKQILTPFGPEKSLKSSTAIELALALTCPPQNWYGIEITEPMAVLYIFFEGEPGELKDKQLRAMVKYPNANLDTIIFKHFDELELDEPRGLMELKMFIDSLPWKPDIIFIDPWGSCLEDENSTRNHKRAVQNIMSLEYRWVIVHHRSKPGEIPRTMGEMMRGSGILGQKAQTLVGYFPNPQKEEEITMRFKSRGPRIPAVTIECDIDGVIRVVTPTWHPSTQEEKAQVAIWDLLSRETAKLVTPEMTVSDLEAEIAAQLGTSSRTVKKAWQKMAGRGIVRERQEGKQKFLNISPLELEPTFPL